MENILLLIIGFIVGIEAGYYFYFSPRAVIKRLLRQMFKIPIKLARAKRTTNDTENFYYNSAKKALSIRHKTINDLLGTEYFFDLEKDRKYTQETKEYAQSLLDNVEKIFND